MSDGNFNRVLLPHTPYASGLKAGKAMGRVKAKEAFAEWIKTFAPTLTDEEISTESARFASLLAKKM